MDALNQLSMSTPVSDTVKKHPLGSFEGMITNVTQYMHAKLQKVCWDIDIKTVHGNPPSYTIFGFNDQDIAELQFSDAARARAAASIGRLKALINNVTGVSKDTLATTSYDDLLRYLPAFKGRHVEVVVQQDRKDPQYQRVFINAPSLTPSPAGVVSQTQSFDQPKVQPAQTLQPTQPTHQPQFNPRGVDLDSIPF